MSQNITESAQGVRNGDTSNPVEKAAALKKLILTKLADASVFAHISGPVGSGKTTVGSRIREEQPGVVVKNLDDFNDEAEEALGLKQEDVERGLPDSIFSEYMAHRNKGLTAFLQENTENKPVILEGVPDEGFDYTPEHRFALNTSAARSAFRAWRRGNYYGIPTVFRHYNQARKDITRLRDEGYTALSSDELMARLSEALANRNVFKNEKTGSSDGKDVALKRLVLTKLADLMPGGEGDDKPDNVFDSKSLAKAQAHESEHTTNPEIAKEIAKDHLTEDKDYYEKLEKVEKDAAIGIPSRQDFGDWSKLQPGQIHSLFGQRHDARRAGTHKDFRIGSPDTGLYSWATRKELPEPGQRVGWFQQPIHSYDYGSFSGEIPSGYGAGMVKKVLDGKILVTKVTPDELHFATAHERHPRRFALIRGSRGDKGWILVNTTPSEALPYQKVHHKLVPREQAEETLRSLPPGSYVQPKIDGASALIKLLKDRIELTSYRTSKETGRPIVHTERFWGGKTPEGLKIPPELVGSVLRGELYGERQQDIEHSGIGQKAGGDIRICDGRISFGSSDRVESDSDSVDSQGSRKAAGDEQPRLGEDGQELRAVDTGETKSVDEGRASTSADGSSARRVIHPSELGSYLNSAVARSLEQQRLKNVLLRVGLFDIEQHGKNRVDFNQTPYSERRKMLESIAQFLPADRFHLMDQVSEPEAAVKMWQDISSGRHGQTDEGVVIWPPTGRPMKIKTTSESDVHVAGTFPGEGRRASTIGGLTYSETPGGPIRGRIGTGFSDQLLNEIASDPEAYIGRVARIRSQERLPSGAYRAPSFLAFHEDTPTIEDSDAHTTGGQIRASHSDRTGTESPRMHKLAMALSLYLRGDAGDTEFSSNGRANTILRLFDARAKTAATKDTRNVKDGDLFDLAQYDSEVRRPEPQGLLPIRGAQDSRLFQLAERLHSFLQGHGRAAKELQSGEEEQRRALLQGELRVGFAETASKKSSKYASDCGTGPEFDCAGMGGAHRTQFEYNPREVISRKILGRGGSDDLLVYWKESNDNRFTEQLEVKDTPTVEDLNVQPDKNFRGIDVGSTSRGDPSKHAGDAGEVAAVVRPVFSDPGWWARRARIATGCSEGDKEAEDLLSDPFDCDVDIDNHKEAGAVDELLIAKEHSDNRRYDRKHAILRKMVEDKPDDFFIDSRDGAIVGLTHTPSGFRLHVPARVLPDAFRIKSAAYRKVVLAIDLDGTLAKEEGKFDPKKIEEPRDGAKAWMTKLHNAGATLVIYTVRGDDEVTRSWLEEHDIPYDFINESPIKPKGSSHKLCASKYVDNRGIDASGPWDSFGPDLLEFVTAER